MLHWNSCGKYFYIFIPKMWWSFPQVAADDLDQGQNGQVTYSIRSSSMSGLFKIDPLTGSITTAAIMDREIWTQTKWVLLLCSPFFFLFVCNHILPCGFPQLISALDMCMFNVCYCDNIHSLSQMTFLVLMVRLVPVHVFIKKRSGSFYTFSWLLCFLL